MGSYNYELVKQLILGNKKLIKKNSIRKLRTEDGLHVTKKGRSAVELEDKFTAQIRESNRRFKKWQQEQKYAQQG